MVFRNLVFAAVVVGMLSGLVLGVVQLFAVTPTILAAETFEIVDETAAANEGHSHGHGSDGHSHSHDANAWGPEDGIERTFYTFFSNILAGIGFSLMLLGAMTLSGKADVKRGLVWGLAGYATFFVAPTLGLDPEIPGMEAANIQGRQGWWIMTVLFTGVGFGLIAFAQKGLKIAGLALLAVPHILGAPLPPVHGFSHPDPKAVAELEALAESFVYATAIANAVFWVVLGMASGFFMNKFSILKAAEDER